MIATCIVETALLIYTVIRYRFTSFARLAASALFLLAVFQLCEFHVCRGGGPSAAAWSRIGFVAITLLPPIGLHVIRTIAGRGVPRWLIAAAYASAAVFALLFGLSSGVFRSNVCAGNYAIFQLRRPLGGLYFGYYYGWLTVGICLSIYLSIAGGYARCCYYRLLVA